MCVVTESEKTLAEVRRDTERDRRGHSEQEGAQLQEELRETRAASESLEQVLAPAAALLFTQGLCLNFKHDTKPKIKYALMKLNMILHIKTSGLI